LQEQCAEIDKQNKEMSMLMQELESQAMLKDGMFSSFMPALVCVWFLKVVIEIYGDA
jgi:hypothetical protein